MLLSVFEGSQDEGLDGASKETSCGSVDVEVAGVLTFASQLRGLTLNISDNNF